MRVMQLNYGRVCIDADKLDESKVPICIGDCVDCVMLNIGEKRRCDC